MMNWKKFVESEENLMSIYFDEQSRIFYLESKDTTYAFGVNPLGILEHLYFGKRVGRDLAFRTYSEKGGAHSVVLWDEDKKHYDLAVVPQEIHTPYRGDYYEPSIILEFANGNRRSDLIYESHEIFAEKPQLEGLPSLRHGETLAVTLRSKTAKVILYYTVSETCAIIARSMKVVNEGEEDLRIDRAYSFAFSLPNRQWQAMYLAGAAGAEAHVRKTSLDRGVFTIDSKRGISSASMNPFMAIGLPETSENRGPAYGVNIIYSGSHSITAERIPSGLVRVSGGLNAFDFSWKLEQGESFQTPEVVLAYSEDGYSGMSREFHNIYREALIPKRFVHKPRPVIINHWEATRFIYTLDRLRSIVEQVAGRGIDTFVLDDGWFGVREDETSGLGDWFVNEEKLGGPLQSLIDYTHSLGMRFGLWFEPEMINRNSELYRAHPDWAIQTPDDYAEEARRQLVLDLTREDVRDYLVETVNGIIRSHKIDYVKWDCNRDLSEGYSLALPKDRQKELFHRYYLGLYDLFRRIVEANPDVIFEGCSSGGSRFDAGVLYYFPQIWTSDQTDAPARAKIQYGTSFCYPMSAMSCHVTASPNRRAKHLTTLHSRYDIAAMGPLGYELDTTKMTEEELAEIPLQIAAFKEDEEMVFTGDTYRLHSPFGDSNYFAMQSVSADKKKSRVTVMKLQENFNEPEIRVYPQGLDPDTVYEVAELGRTMEGRSWMNFGFRPKVAAGDYETKVFRFIAK
ncbi:MAG: alpha-galactosidase [Oscillospiraceae bacterium]|nr:alpha-galactosidase [Oscillospiraceae bacterium]